MNLVKIEMYARGYYSDSEVSETVYIKQESYEKMKEEIDEINIWIYELDGKHSEVKADIEITTISQEDVNSEDYTEYLEEDNYRLIEHIGEVYDNKVS